MKAKLEFNRLIKLDTISNAFAFVLEKTNNNGFSSFSSDSNKQAYCKTISVNKTYNSQNRFMTRFDAIKNTNITQKHSHALVLFELDLVNRQAKIKRIGSDLKSISVEPKLTNKNGFGSLLSGDSKLNDTLFDMSTDLKTEDETNAFDMLYNPDKTDVIYFNVTNNASFVFKFEVNIKTTNEEGLYILSLFNCFQPQNLNYKLSEEDFNIKKTSTRMNDPLSLAAEKSVKETKASFDFNDIKYGINLEVNQIVKLKI